MKRFALVIVILAAASMLPSILPAFAQAAMSSWPFLAEVNTRSGAPGAYDLALPLQVMDKSREDLADLRLFDANGKEIPYALRIRRDVDDKREVGGRLFNYGNAGSKASEASVDLGENPGEHNEVEIETAGTNFRRSIPIAVCEVRENARRDAGSRPRRPVRRARPGSREADRDA